MDQHESPVGKGLADFDARPILATGSDPLHRILEVLEGLRPDGVLLLIAPFRPGPLVVLLGERGFRSEVRRLADGSDHVVEFRGDGCPEITDLTDLEAPGPLERVLEAVAALLPGEEALFRLPRRPGLLLDRLDPALRLELVTAPDGITLARIGRPAGGAS